MRLSTPLRRNTRRKTTRTPGAPKDPGARRLACPTCAEDEGFLLTVDGAVYRVLEDDRDTDLVAEAGGPAQVFVTCSACKTTMLADTILQRQETDLEVDPPTPEIRMGPRRHRIHPAGKAAQRDAGDGRTLPMCPECGATHDFFVDLDGAAYRVLEDDDDTDLLGEATNLLCARCHAVFEL